MVNRMKHPKTPSKDCALNNPINEIINKNINPRNTFIPCILIIYLSI